MIPTVHLPARGMRSSIANRANPLIGPLPERVKFDGAELRDIVRFLDVERSARYKAERGKTFCNVYAYDYCYLAGVFLPRVWWTAAAIAAMKDGPPLPVRYADTVVELNANALHQWMVDYGQLFGWRYALSLDQLQTVADGGGVCVITGIRKDLSRSGHIACVIPQAEGCVPKLDAGHCLAPVQSQAGAHNYCASTMPGRWWEGAQFAGSGFWINRPNT